MYRIRTLKKIAVILLLFTAIFSCKKNKPNGNPSDPGGGTSSVFESILTHPIISYCGTAFTSNLKIQDGTDVGTVTVGNDGSYLYLTYTLTGNWYLGDANCYAGKESLIPKNIDGNPLYTQFPGKQQLDFCDLRQTFTFRVLLSSLGTDNDALCPTNERYYVAMRASVKQFSNANNCTTGSAQPAWGAPFLINPGSASEWATAFYYCKQDCNTQTPPWCAYSQGYWFHSQNGSWCQDARFGSLDVTRQQGVALWPAQTNWVRKAFFQASALQLSMNCVNNGNAIPNSIVSDYNRVATFLSAISYSNIQNGTFPSGVDTSGVKASTGRIGSWICYNHCNADSTACAGN